VGAFKGEEREPQGPRGEAPFSMLSMLGDVRNQADRRPDRVIEDGSVRDDFVIRTEDDS
jgi:hypothetical protein